MYSFMTAAASQTLVMALFALHFVQGWWLPSRRSGRTPPVILVHGLYHNSSAWLFFARRLARRGYTDLHTVSYNSFKVDYDQIVERIEQKIGDIQAERPPGMRAILIGHSLGGLAIRGWLSKSGNAGRALAVVTLGTPHKGSKVAGLGVGSLARSLMHRGRLIKKIEAEDKPPPCPALSLFTPVDNMVIPAENLHIDVPGWREKCMEPVSHVAMLYSSEAVEASVDFIQEVVAGSPHTRE
jgi:triacylglycerol esterase/lipase EstA (alpha/beta hydrolase family)